MAMAQKSLPCFRILGVKSTGLFSNNSSTATVSRMPVATITSRQSRVEPEDKPAPWPYKERGFRNWHAFIDKTKKRIGENSKIIVVEGLPGVGKSKLARTLAEELEMYYFPMVTTDNHYINQYGYDNRVIDKDVIPLYRSFDEYDFLKHPYSEKVLRVEFLLWTLKYLQYMDALAHVLNTGQGVILDRCIYSAPVFQDALFDRGHLKKPEREALLKLEKRHMPDLMKPHLIVYLDTPVDVVEQNLKNRGLGEEKVWNKELLQRVEYHYKNDYLKTITEHAELLAYDWTVPGDGEVVVEDIERIDFEQFKIHDPKMEDWRIKDEWDWAEKRWEFTNMGRQNNALYRIVVTEALFYFPAVMLHGDDGDDYLTALNKVPGNKFPLGYNRDLGDKPGWGMRLLPRIWTDHCEERQEKERAKRKGQSPKA